MRNCDGPATSLPAAFAAQLPPPPNPSSLYDRGSGSDIYTIDHVMSALARWVPGGFAGVYFENERSVLRLVDPSKAAEAKEAIGGRLPGYQVAGAEPRAARWDFAQLYDWWRYLLAQNIWGDLTLADIDEVENRLYFGMLDGAARDRLTRDLVALGAPCDLVLVGITPPFVLEGG